MSTPMPRGCSTPSATARSPRTMPGAWKRRRRRGAGQGGLTPLEPPAGKSPDEVNAYWDALAPEQQQELLRDRPDLLGNVDGIPSPIRHAANVARLDDVLRQLEDRRDQLTRQIRFGGLFTNEDAELEQVGKKIRDVQTLQELMADNEWSPSNLNGRMLLVMDMFSGGEQGKAAISIGNPDDADHVSVTTPGLNTNIRNSFGSMLGESAALRDETLDELQRAGRGHERVATVSWLDFEPPDSDGSRPSGWSWLEVAQQDRASDGAPELANFYRAIDATSNKADPHIVALGHSYRSLTQGLALQTPGGHPVDDAVFYGSPGFEANDEPELGARGRSRVRHAGRERQHLVRSVPRARRPQRSAANLDRPRATRSRRSNHRRRCGAARRVRACRLSPRREQR